LFTAEKLLMNIYRSEKDLTEFHVQLVVQYNKPMKYGYSCTIVHFRIYYNLVTLPEQDAPFWLPGLEILRKVPEHRKLVPRKMHHQYF
jgi:hypothetical protein